MGPVALALCLAARGNAECRVTGRALPEHNRRRRPLHNPHVHLDERQIAWTPLPCRVPAKQ